MSGIVPGYEYDIFISYRQKDNKGDKWVSEFVDALKTELESTFKEEISVYFDINPHDGLLETHDVDASLKEKLKCLVFIPIISRTYCDPKSFAWEHEFKAFVEQATRDRFGLKVKLSNGNVASRALPVRIHDLDNEDIKLCESVLGGVLRGIEFIYKEAGVNRSLSPKDREEKNLYKTNYRNQINKVALAIKEIISGLKTEPAIQANKDTSSHEPLDKVKKEDAKIEFKVPVKLTIYKLIAGIFILGLLLVLMLILPIRYKGRDNLQAMTMKVSVMNESGKMEAHTVFKDDYVTRLMIFPFTNETTDSSKNWVQFGIYDALREDLIQFNYIELGSYTNATHIQEQLKEAGAKNYPQFLSGTYRVTEGIYEITSRLYKTANGTTISERVYKGRDLFNLLDSISLRTRIDLGIPDIILTSSPDLPVKEAMTNSLDAFRFYVNGIYYFELNYPSIYLGINKAINLDSTFAIASYSLASDNHWYQTSKESASRDIKRAMRHRQRLSEFREISTRILYYSIIGETEKAVTLSENLYRLQPNNINLLLKLAETYQNNLNFTKLVEATQKLNKLVPAKPEYQLLLARSYLLSAKLDKGLDVLKSMLKVNPENVDVLFLMGEIYIQNNDLEAAEKVIESAKLFQPEKEKAGNVLLDHIAYIRNNSMGNEFMKPITGNYRYETTEQNLTCLVNNQHFTLKASNQMPIYIYPVSDSEFISTVNNTYKFTFIKNNRGKTIKISYITGARNTPRILFKEDSLIVEAKNFLDSGNKVKALSAFRKAYEQNPENYYLANFIKHLEFIQSENYEKYRPVLKSYIGRYGELEIYEEKDGFYYKDNEGLIYKLLPLTDNEFMIPSKYNRIIQVIKENVSIKGLKFIYRNGEEEYFPKNN